MQRYNHNAVSGSSPTHFQVSHSIITQDKLMISRKKLVVPERCEREEMVPRKFCRSLPPMDNDQDLDSIRFSDREAVKLGLKNSVRHKSKFYQEFYNNIEKTFKKPKKQITFMQPVKKITRNTGSPVQTLNVQKSIRRLLERDRSGDRIRDVDPGFRMLKDYKRDESECRSPFTTGVNFSKQSLPNLAKVSGKINCILISQEIREFEKKVPKAERNKGNLWYNTLIGN